MIFVDLGALPAERAGLAAPGAEAGSRVEPRGGVGGDRYRQVYQLDAGPCARMLDRGVEQRAADAVAALVRGDVHAPHVCAVALLHLACAENADHAGERAAGDMPE